MNNNTDTNNRKSVPAQAGIVLADFDILAILAHAWSEDSKDVFESFLPQTGYLQLCLACNPQLENQSLAEVIRQGVTNYDRKYEPKSLLIDYAPTGFSSICREVASKYGLSNDEFYSLALKHGTLRLVSRPVIIEAWQMFQLAVSRLERFDVDSQLETPENLKCFHKRNHFKRTRINIDGYWWVEALLTMIARVCGINIEELAPIAICLSLGTLSDSDTADNKYENISLEFEGLIEWLIDREPMLIKLISDRD